MKIMPRRLETANSGRTLTLACDAVNRCTAGDHEVRLPNKKAPSRLIGTGPFTVCSVRRLSLGDALQDRQGLVHPSPHDAGPAESIRGGDVAYFPATTGRA